MTSIRDKIVYNDGQVHLGEDSVNIVFVSDSVRTNNEVFIKTQVECMYDVAGILSQIRNPFTRDKLREHIRYLEFNGVGRKGTTELEKEYNIVRKIAFPSMTLIFYTLLIQNLHIPTFDEFFNAFIYNQPQYFKINSNETVTVLYKNQNKTARLYAVETRLWLSYAGFIRDIDAFYGLYESNQCSYVKLSTKSDFNEGIDVQFILNGHKTLHKVDFKNTKKAKYMKANSNALVVDMGIETSFCEKVGDYELFNDNAIKYLIDRAYCYE